MLIIITLEATAACAIIFLVSISTRIPLIILVIVFFVSEAVILISLLYRSLRERGIAFSPLTFF